MSLSDSLAHLEKEYSEFQVEVLLLHLLERLVVVPHGATRGAKRAATMDGMGADGMGGGWESEGGRMWERSWQGGGGQGRQGRRRWSTQGQLEAQSTSPLLLSRDQHIDLRLTREDRVILLVALLGEREGGPCGVEEGSLSRRKDDDRQNLWDSSIDNILAREFCSF